MGGSFNFLQFVDRVQKREAQGLAVLIDNGPFRINLLGSMLMRIYELEGAAFVVLADDVAPRLDGMSGPCAERMG